MRQRLGRRKVLALRRQTGLPIVAVLVRGGTEHRRDLCFDDGSVVSVFNDGTTEKSDIQHGVPREHWIPMEG